MEQVDLDECIDLSHWIEATAAGFRLMAEDVLDGLSADEEWEAALELADVLLTSDTENPQVHALRLRALTGLEGEEAAEAALAEIGLPDRETITDLWRGMSGFPEVKGRTQSTFVGRKSELAQMANELSETKTGGSRMVLLEGNSGIGKTALLNRFVKTRVLKGDIALVATATEAEQKVPFGVLEQWLEAIPDRFLARHAGAPWWTVLNGLFPSLSPDYNAQLTDPVEHRRLLEALRRLFATLAETTSLIVSVDDAHYADSASLTFVSYLLGKGHKVPVLLVLARRAGARGGLDSLVDRYSATRLALDPLSEADIELWLRRARVGEDDPSAEVVSRLFRRTGGTPLLLASLVESKDPDAFTPEHLPQSVVEYYRPILIDLSPAPMSILVALSIIGGCIHLDMLHEVVGLSSKMTASSCADLLQAGLVVVGSEGEIKLRHGIVGEVALSLASESEQRRLHGRTARLNERRRPLGTAMSAVSHDIAGNKEDAFAAATQAAQSCAVLNAHTERLFFLKLAIANAPSLDAAAGQRVALAEVLMTLGRPGEAIDSLDPDVVRGAKGATRIRIQAQRVAARLALAETAEEVEQCWLQAQALAGKIEPAALARLYSDVAGAAHDLGVDTLASQILNNTRHLVEKMPASNSRSELLLRPIRLAGLSDDCSRAFKELEALPAAEPAAIEYRCKLQATRGILWMSAGKPASAEAEFADALFVAERHGLYANFFMLYNNLAVSLIEQGRYAEAETQLWRAAEYASFDMHPAQYSLMADNRAILYYETKRYSELLSTARESLLTGKTKGRRSLLHTFGMIGLAELALGRLGKAREAEREVRLLQSESHPLRGDSSYIHTFVAKMQVAGGNPREAINYLDARAAENPRALALYRWRLELEADRVRCSAGIPITRIENLLAELEESGARPLLERAHGLRRRSLR